MRGSSVYDAGPMTDRVLDLRSDTVTHPTPEMRRAMADAKVGDDVFGDDPTVIALEERAAELTGKEAALFVASGTMGNLVSMMAQVPRGGEIITPEGGHQVQHEAANHAVVVGASIKTVPWGPDGRMALDDIREAIKDGSDTHDPITALVSVENSHSDSMGQPLPPDYVDAVGALAHEHGIPLHVDGARLFNAAVALGVTARDLLRSADSASFCLSKGLSCPVGSLVVGSRDTIWRARRARKVLGGGMRQAGVLAAPGLIALRDGPAGMIERLAEDHANARRLADGIAELPGITGLDPSRVRTDFVLFTVRPANEDSLAAKLTPRQLRRAFLDALARRGVLLIDYSGDRIVRAVTHYGIEATDIDRIIAATREALDEIGAGNGRATTGWIPAPSQATQTTEAVGAGSEVSVGS
jgi:threonine aldolase